MIFAAIERLATAGGGEPHQRIAIALGRNGLSMPHGNQGAVIEALLALPQPLRSKWELLTAIVLDGEAISAELPLQAVREWLAAAREKTWMYHESLLEVEGWLQLLPFSDRPAAPLKASNWSSAHCLSRDIWSASCQHWAMLPAKKQNAH
jgi:hypothetical protein